MIIIGNIKNKFQEETAWKSQQVEDFLKDIWFEGMKIPAEEKVFEKKIYIFLQKEKIWEKIYKQVKMDE